MDQIKLIANQFFPTHGDTKIERISRGHINATFKISFGKKESYILQKVNSDVFNNPLSIMENIRKVADHLKKSHYPLKILWPIASANGYLLRDEPDGFWRAFPFFENTTVLDKVDQPEQAYEAAKAFGLFIRHLADMNPSNLIETIPDFHHLPFRFTQLEKAIRNCKNERIEKAKESINLILKWQKTIDFQL